MTDYSGLALRLASASSASLDLTSDRLAGKGWHAKVDVKLPGKGNSNSHGARPVHLIITMIKWIRTSRLSIKNSLPGRVAHIGRHVGAELHPTVGS